MVTKINSLLFIFLLITITLLLQKCSCKKINIDCSRTIYTFKISIEVFPQKDTLKIGDTIWFRLNSPVQLRDLNSNTFINYSSAANLGSVVNFRALSTSKEYTIDAVSMFTYNLKEGIELRSTNDNIEYRFGEKNNNFLFLVGIIPKNKGTYRIVFSNAANVFRNTDKCTKASFQINISNSDRHPYLNPFYSGGLYPEGGDYYFVVK
jgi:hypothetical protein